MIMDMVKVENFQSYKDNGNVLKNLMIENVKNVKPLFVNEKFIR